jgi:hypothetical protein
MGFDLALLVTFNNFFFSNLVIGFYLAISVLTFNNYLFPNLVLGSDSSNKVLTVLSPPCRCLAKASGEPYILFNFF